MHHIRLDVVQQTLVVSNHDAAVFRCLQLVHPFGHDTERIDIQAGIGFVKNAELRFEHRHLEDFISLLLTTTETFIHRTVGQLVIQFHHRTLFTHQFQKFTGSQGRLSFVLALFIHGSAHKVHHAYSRNLYRILEREEQTCMATVFRTQFQQILTFENHRAFGYLKRRMTDQYRRKGTLSRTVRSHDGMNLALLDAEVDTFQYFFAIDTGM